MSGKCRPSLRKKTLANVMRSPLSVTDKECVKAVFERFDNMVEVKHGRWMHSLPVRVKSAERNIPIATEYLYTQCSECKHCFLMKMDGFNYCPNCGVKMDGKDESNET